MANRIQTTHVGSLPRPQKLIDIAHQRTVGEKFDQGTFDERAESTRWPTS